MNKQVLDPCCGGRMFYFDKDCESVLYADQREEEHVLCDGRVLKVSPDQIVDFRNMPFDDCCFKLVVFDPPHFNQLGKSSWMAKKYGVLNEDWKEDLSQGFNECWRVLDYGGTLIFKWNETQIKIRDVLACFSQKPLFGHRTTKNLKTHWMTFYKQEGGV